MRLSVELCAVYWHFLLVVWLVLFGLLCYRSDRIGQRFRFFDLSHSLTVSLYLPRLKMRPQRTQEQMTEPALPNTLEARAHPGGWRGIVADWSSDQRAFKNVSWGKAMMWIFLLSDTFIFSCFLLSYMTVRMSTTVPWPNPGEVFALTIGGTTIPSHPDRHHDLHFDQQQRDDGDGGQFRLPPRSRQKRGLDAGDRGIWRHIRRNAGFRMDQADHGRRAALGKPLGRGPVWLDLFHDHGLPRYPRDDRRDFPDHHFAKSVAGRFRPGRRGFFTSRKGRYEIVEIMGLYWHFVDLVWVFIFALFYLW